MSGNLWVVNIDCDDRFTVAIAKINRAHYEYLRRYSDYGNHWFNHLSRAQANVICNKINELTKYEAKVRVYEQNYDGLKRMF